LEILRESNKKSGAIVVRADTVVAGDTELGKVGRREFEKYYFAIKKSLEENYIRETQENQYCIAHLGYLYLDRLKDFNN